MKENKNANERITYKNDKGDVFVKFTPRFGKPFYAGKWRGDGFSFSLSAMRFNQIVKSEDFKDVQGNYIPLPTRHF
jgi:hypothetical protein